ncbi:MarR family transcriptional regulator [Rhizobium sp. 18065]|uniref:MarR family winged helix-turn-helix transcriptional regulator n=1 Tax=Rhizobium sp. 18065 TaxID=2681411 RepID=UPI00135C594D|nr:MarR family transcriptional regulator [Rhizobium sp. 18065]
MRTDDWSRAKTSGLNTTRLAILELLERRRDGLGVKEIAANLGVSQPTATDSITAPERKGFVAKRMAATDKRGANVGITPEGLSVSEAGRLSRSVAEQSVGALAEHEQEDLLITLVNKRRLTSSR